MKKIKTGEFSKVIYIIATLFAIIVRYFLMVNTTVWHSVGQGYDDTLYLDGTQSLLSGSWLGEYNNRTLIKLESIYLFFSINHILHIPYMVSIFLLYLFSAIQMTVAFRPILKKKWMKLLVFAFVLYMPIGVSWYHTARIMRNALAVPCSLLVLSAFIGIYLRIDASCNKRVFWFILTAIELPFYLLLREESVLICATLMGLIVCEFIHRFIDSRKMSHCIRKMSLWAIPIISIIIYIEMICGLNEHFYGLHLLSDRTQGGFSKTMDLITSIDDNPEDSASVIVTTRMRDIAIENSPSLQENDLYITIGWNWENWSAMRGRDDGQVTGDDYIWAFRNAAAIHGIYDDAVKAEDFWDRVYREIDEAYKCGKINRKKGLKLSSSFQPLSMADFVDTFKKTLVDIYNMSSFTCNIKNAYLKESSDETRIAEKIFYSNYLYEQDKDKYNLDFFEQISSISNVLAKPYWLLGKPLYIICIISFFAWTVGLLFTHASYYEWEKWVTVLGIYLTLVLQGFVICTFSRPWGDSSYYLAFSQSFIIVFEIMEIVFSARFMLDFHSHIKTIIKR